MTTIEKKLEKARKRREALVLAEAEQTARLADRERDAREAELTELLEATKPKLVRLAALRTRLTELLGESDRLVAQSVAPSWMKVQTAADQAKDMLEAFCAQQGLPAPRGRQRIGVRDLVATAPWLPLPLIETTDPHTRTVRTGIHPAFDSFGIAFVAVWKAEEKSVRS